MSVVTPSRNHLVGDMSTWRDIELHRVVIRRMGRDDVAIVRHDGRAAIHGRRLAGEVVALLQRSPSLRRVRAQLDARYGADVDLTTLLRALARGGLLSRVDGLPYTSAPIQPWRAFRVWLTCTLDLRRRIMNAAARHFPPALALRLVPRLLRRPLGRTLRPAVAATTTHMLPFLAGAIATDRLTAEHVAAVATQHAMIRVLCEASPRRVARWLGTHVRLDGRECLDSASRRGPVLLVGLHHDAYPLLGAALLSHGYPFHAFHHAEDVTSTGFAAAMARYAGPCGWATATYHGNARLHGVRDFIAALRRGGRGLVLADYYERNRTPGSGGQEEYESRLSQYRGVGKAIAGDSVVDVPFGATAVRVHGWVGWLAARTRATVLPIRVRTRVDDRHVVTIGDAVAWRYDEGQPWGDDTPDATKRIVEPLLADVLAAPARWMYLTTFRSRVSAGARNIDQVGMANVDE